jgi:beta-lactam-binding protein with PASTA domain
MRFLSLLLLCSTLWVSPAFSQATELTKEQLAAIVTVLLGSNQFVEQAIPDFSGLDQSVAQQVVEFLDLPFAGFEIVDDNQNFAGTVIGQSIAPGIYDEEQDGIILQVSRGFIQAIVPNLVGRNQTNAYVLVSDAELSLGVIMGETSNSTAAGNVLRQSPNPGTEVEAGTTVDVTFSVGASGVTVPNIVGQTTNGAESTLGSSGLQLGTTSLENSNTVTEGRIASQQPSAGALFFANARVNAGVSSGIGKQVVVNQPTAASPDNVEDLPSDTTSGLPLLFEIDGTALVYDQSLNDPLTAWGDCLSMISACEGPVRGNDYDDCTRSAQVCQTAEP